MSDSDAEHATIGTSKLAHKSFVSIVYIDYIHVSDVGRVGLTGGVHGEIIPVQGVREISLQLNGHILLKDWRH